MKKYIENVDAIPSKRLFLSIIVDYDLNKSICELIDNALDIWAKQGKQAPLIININLDTNQQTITVHDNAGGLKKSELSFIVGPGQTSNLPEEETIGIFGVGTKRAVVALAQEIRITTRYSSRKTFRIEFDDSWLNEKDNWELPVYEVDNISPNTTIIELQKLRFKISDPDISKLKEHLEATYARFLRHNNVTIKIENNVLAPISFENWAYPPLYPPHKYTGILRTDDGKSVEVAVQAGLVLESSPTGGEYGVYFYCNDRLIARGLKSYDVGFAKGLAGRPHPSISLTRVIISLWGEAVLMPWNSSKSDIYTNHHIFIALRDWLVNVVKDYASLSRRWEGAWQEEVFKHKTGRIKHIHIENFQSARKSYLPPLPQSKPRYVDIIKTKNKKIANKKPWAKGLYEGIISVDLILKQSLEQKNRIAMILLDSTLEIAFKEYLVNDSGVYYTNKKILDLFQSRKNVEKEIKKYVDIPDSTWSKIKYFYDLRCKLIHERATVGISDSDINTYRKIVQQILTKLFNLKF